MILFGIVFYQCNSNPKKAKAEYKSTNIDFGSTTHNDTVNVKYNIENMGGLDLIIESVSPGCQCTVSSYSKEPIKPNQMGEIVVRYIPKPTDSGKVFQEIVVKTNSEKKLQLLTLSGQIIN